jgi:hypothetical protein
MRAVIATAFHIRRTPIDTCPWTTFRHRHRASPPDRDRMLVSRFA